MHRQLDNEVLCTNVKQGDMIWVLSEQFGCECWAYASELYEYGLNVRLELPDDHPSMVEAMADTGYDADNIELYAIVPFTCVEFIRHLAADDEPIRVWTRPLTSSERAERARLHGFTRVSFPDLDAGLRCVNP